MVARQYVLPLARELVVDLFAGGGGASTGIEQAIGRHVDIAVNHDPEAVSLHTANHPQTKHFCCDVFEVNPVVATGGQPVGLLWASPSCTHFSKARGGKPVSKQLRSLAWVVVRWASKVRPRVIMLENVEEFQTWGPVGRDGAPCPRRRGHTFELWVQALRKLGYAVEWRELRAADFGTPTTRKRMFLVARCDGAPIVWPAPTHAQPGKSGAVPAGRKPWRSAAECIDWSIPCPSIFERAKPLADATCRRIAKGLVRYVMEAAQPFIVQYHSAKRAGDDRVASLHPPLPTQTTENRFALVTAFLAKHYTGATGSALQEPVATVTACDHHSLVTANLIHMGHGEGSTPGKRFSHGIRSVEQPLNTITASGAAAGLVTSHLVKLRGDNVGGPVTEPLPTVSAQGTHHAEVRAFLIKYYGNEIDGVSLHEPMHTLPTRDRMGLVTVVISGETWVVVDIGLRMLQPHELYRAQGFPASYQITHGAAGEAITKTAQVRMCGNSVCPQLAQVLVEANYERAVHQPVRSTRVRRAV